MMRFLVLLFSVQMGCKCCRSGAPAPDTCALYCAVIFCGEWCLYASVILAHAGIHCL